MNPRNRITGRFGWLLFLVAVSAWACRYSVRDTGFVDLGLETYQLRWVPGAGIAADTANRVRTRAQSLLRDSNLVWDDAPAGEGIPQEPGLSLRDAGGRVLDLRDVGGSGGGDQSGEAGRILSVVKAVAMSPLRERLYREGLRSYAVVLLVEGSDAAANERVRTDAVAAIAAITRLLPTLPKPVDTPPQWVSIPLKDQEAEKVTIWGLGMDPAPSSSPRLAIVYGRGRRLGAPLEGPLITQTALRDRLLLIGQDCECDLDRAWLRGPLLPGRWDRELQQAALSALGFDPGNPMVRAEISRIVERGPQHAGRRKPPSAGTSLGYSEESVEATEETVAEEADPPAPSPSPSTETTPSGGSPTQRPAAGRRLWFLLGGGLAVLLASGLALWFRASRR